MVQPNAYTLPSIQTTLGAQVAGFTGLAYILYGLVKLSKSGLELQSSSKNIIQMANKGNINMLLWQTIGLKDILPEPELRHAIYLHEIGHWVRYEPVFGSIISRIFGDRQNFPILGPLIVPLSIVGIVLGRSAEWKADEFAKKAGYGKELAESLRRMGYTVRSNSNIYVKIQDYMRAYWFKIHNVVDKFLPVTIHPSMRKRTAALSESEIINEGIIKDGAMFALRTLLSPLDKFISKNVKQLFPMLRR